MSCFSAFLGQNRTKWLCVPFFMVTAACDSPFVRDDSPLVQEAKEAEKDGRIISNPAMSQLYPQSYVPGQPQYLERDFEAGADFICNEIKVKYDRDICAEPVINWR